MIVRSEMKLLPIAISIDRYCDLFERAHKWGRLLGLERTLSISPGRGSPPAGPPPCCVWHALPGAFSPIRRVCGAAHDEVTGEGQVGFSDATAKAPSPFATSTPSHTIDLFESAGRGQWILVRGGNVLTMRDRVALPEHDVLIRDGLIQDVRPTGTPAPPGTLFVEAAGKHVVPGFSDLHTHPFLKTWADAWGKFLPDGVRPEDIVLPYDLLIFQYLAAGVTRIEVMAGCADMLELRASIERGAMHGPRMRIGSPLIDGDPPIQSPQMSWIANNEAGGRRAAQAVAERGFDFAKPYSRLSREAYRGLAEQCRALGLRMMGHVTPHVGIEDAIVLGQGGIAHAAEYFYNERGERRRDEAMFERYARLTADHGVWVQATVTVSRSMEVMLGKLPLLAPDRHLMHPLMVKLYDLDGPFATMMRDSPDKAYLGDDNFALAVRMTRILHEAGARVLTGTDVANPYLVDGFSLHEEFAHLVEQAGMAPIDVLEASTARAADYHAEAKAGRLAPGMAADIVVLDRDPTQDIQATRAIDTVLVRGTILRKPAIEAGMGRIRDHFAAMPV